MLIYLMLLTAIPQDSAPKPNTPTKEKTVCRSEKTTQSRIAAKPVCRTQSEWDELARQTVDDLRYRGQTSR